MSSKSLSEEDIESRIVKIKAAETDKKVDLIQFLGIELEDVSELPESTIDPLILLLLPLLRSSHPLLLTATLISSLPPFIPLIPLSPTSHLRLAVVQLLPALLEKLNDSKDRVHMAAANLVVSLGQRCFEAEPYAVPPATAKGKEKESLPMTWERFLKDTMMGKAPRAKVEAMKVLVRVRAELGARVSLKAWLAPLVDLLEDGDGGVRDQAKETVVALLSPSSTPPAARSELKKLLLARNVRKTIANDIITRVLGASGAESGRSTPANAFTMPDPSEDAGSGVATPALPPTGDDVEIVYIASPHDLSNEFNAMIPYFEGKETEQNWALREKSVVRIRGMLKGGVWNKYSEAFIVGLKSGIIEGVSKTIVSLRTTVAQQSCFLVKELAEHMGSGFDPFVEPLMPILGKMAGFTKKIIAERSQACVTAILIHSTVNPKIPITHISAGVSDKNIQTRHFCTGHMKTYLDMHGQRSKHVIETGSGLIDLLEGGIKKALGDVNPGVRDLARLAFWSYHSVWSQRASAILNSLDGMARKQLEKANPREAGEITPSAPSTKPTAPAKRATSSVAALLAEKRRAKAAEIAAAAGKMAQESPRVVSGPVPGSPSIAQGLTRSNSSASMSSRAKTSTRRHSPEAEGIDSANTGDSPGSSPVRASPTPPHRTGRTPTYATGSGAAPPSMSRSPPSKRSLGGDSPLRQSTTPTAATLRTPQSHRGPSAHLQRAGLGLGLSDYEHSPSSKDDVEDGDDWATTPTRLAPSDTGVKDDAREAQAAQAESAAQQLVEYAEEPGQDTRGSVMPVTPARPVNGHGMRTPAPASGFQRRQAPGSAFRTPLHRSRAWEDSPRPEAVTPLMMDRLRERKHERSWWVRRQELLDKASPLRPSASSPSSSISNDIEALEGGEPQLRNLQKLALYSTSHPVTSDGDAQAWQDGLSDRLLKGLLGFLQPEQDKTLLEQALVVLWEMVQHQWPLFDGHEEQLLDALFSLRGSRDPTILESTNALISLLTQIADPIYFMTLIRASLDRFLRQHRPESKAEAPGDGGLSNGFSMLSLGQASGSADKTRDSVHLFGLTGLGMCVLRLPEAVVRVEGGKLGEAVMEAMASPSSLVRQCAQSLLLSMQTVLRDSQEVLSLVPGFNQGQKDLTIYYMAQNGILEGAKGNRRVEGTPSRQASGGSLGDELEDGDEQDDEVMEEDKERIMRDMEGLMGRAVALD
ncbi:hypothetical protein IAU60_002628 [Kwoniella sp. DSM 27419]